MLLEEVRKAFAFHELIQNVESDQNMQAMRFEKHFYDDLVNMRADVGRIVSANLCSQSTAYVLASISWGLYQILGWNLYYICGYTKDIVSFLTHKQEQMWCFERFCEKRMGTAFLTLAVKVMDELTELNRLAEKHGKAYLQAKFCDGDMEGYEAVKRFVTLYNGARIRTKAFYAYVDRMLSFVPAILKKYELQEV